MLSHLIFRSWTTNVVRTKRFHWKKFICWQFYIYWVSFAPLCRKCRRFYFVNLLKWMALRGNYIVCVLLLLLPTTSTFFFQFLFLIGIILMLLFHYVMPANNNNLFLTHIRIINLNCFGQFTKPIVYNVTPLLVTP